PRFRLPVRVAYASLPARSRRTRLLRRRGRFATKREYLVHILVRARDEVDTNHLAHLLRPSHAGFEGGLDGGDVAADDSGDVSTADFLIADEFDLRGLDHRVAGFDHRGETSGFNHAEGLLCHVGVPPGVQKSLIVERMGGPGKSRLATVRVFSRSGSAWLASGYPFDRCHSGAPGNVDVGFLTAEVDASERTERADLENIDVRRLFSLVGGQGGICGRLACHNIE